LHRERVASPPTGLEATIARPLTRGEDPGVEPPIEHRDVTTIMSMIGHIQADVRRIRVLLEDEDGEEEEEEREPDG
jgi:hypothetical protein